MKRTYVGLEVGSSTCHVAALDTEGRSVRSLQFPTSEAKLLMALANLPGEVWVELREELPPAHCQIPSIYSLPRPSPISKLTKGEVGFCQSFC